MKIPGVTRHRHLRSFAAIFNKPTYTLFGDDCLGCLGMKSQFLRYRIGTRRCRRLCTLDCLLDVDINLCGLGAINCYELVDVYTLGVGSILCNNLVDDGFHTGRALDDVSLASCWSQKITWHPLHIYRYRDQQF